MPLKPGKHRHEDALDAPVAADDVRSAHGRQSAMECPADPTRNVFAGHDVHTVAPISENVPALQLIQSVWPTVAANVPAWHGTCESFDALTR